MAKCNICNKPIVLFPSAADRAKKYGGTAAEYNAMFTTHAECAVAKRTADTYDLMQRINAERDGKITLKV